ncbi:MAG: LysM peptidoglycan-binding domain-containing protein, partial [Mangrovibacterium sp.]
MRLLLLSVLIFVSLGHAGAQDRLPDENQMDCTLYQVRQGETIYSISRRFLVGQNELVAANPSLVMGLKAGQILKIPGAGSGSGADQGAQEPLKDRENIPAMTEYKVRKGESVYFIARRFG